MKAIYPALPLVLVPMLTLAACSSTPPPAPSPVPTPSVRPTPAPLPPRPAADWRDRPITPGDWTWGIVAGKSSASFGPPGAAPLLTLTCERAAGEVRLARSGSAATSVAMAITTTSGTRPLVSNPALGSTSSVVAALPARDPLLDAIAFSRGRFMVEVAGLPPLYLPSWPEVSRVIEDCR